MTYVLNPIHPKTVLPQHQPQSAHNQPSASAESADAAAAAVAIKVDLPSGLVVDMAIDTRGLRCPMPILRAKKALGTLQSGQVLQVVATDPGSMRDFEAFCRQTGNTLIVQQALPDGLFVHVMTRR